MKLSSEMLQNLSYFRILVFFFTLCKAESKSCNFKGQILVCDKQPYVLKAIKTSRRYLWPPSWSHFEDQGHISKVGWIAKAVIPFLLSLHWDYRYPGFYDGGRAHYLTLCTIYVYTTSGKGEFLFSDKPKTLKLLLEHKSFPTLF